jgi:type VI protein secretion system component VasK
MTILAAAETYLLFTRPTRWDLDAYQDWLATTWTRLAGSRNGTPEQALHAV